VNASEASPLSVKYFITEPPEDVSTLSLKMRLETEENTWVLEICNIVKAPIDENLVIGRGN